MDDAYNRNRLIADIHKAEPGTVFIVISTKDAAHEIHSYNPFSVDGLLYDHQMLGLIEASSAWIKGHIFDFENEDKQ